MRVAAPKMIHGGKPVRLRGPTAACLRIVSVMSIQSPSRCDKGSHADTFSEIVREFALAFQKLSRFICVTGEVTSTLFMNYCHTDDAARCRREAAPKICDSIHLSKKSNPESQE